MLEEFSQELPRGDNNGERPAEKTWRNLDWPVLAAKVESILAGKSHGANLTFTTKFQGNGFFTLTVSIMGKFPDLDEIPEKVKKKIPEEF